MKNLINNTYKFSDQDLFLVLNFIKEYHLNPTKGLRGRTNQGKRNFGGELDEWLPGKLIEIVYVKFLKKTDLINLFFLILKFIQIMKWDKNQTLI